MCFSPDFLDFRYKIRFLWIFMDFLVPGTMLIQSGSKNHKICRRNCVKWLNIHPEMGPGLLKKSLSTLLSKTELLSGFDGKPAGAKCS